MTLLAESGLPARLETGFSTRPDDLSWLSEALEAPLDEVTATFQRLRENGIVSLRECPDAPCDGGYRFVLDRRKQEASRE